MNTTGCYEDLTTELLLPIALILVSCMCPTGWPYGYWQEHPVNLWLLAGTPCQLMVTGKNTLSTYGYWQEHPVNLQCLC